MNRFFIGFIFIFFQFVFIGCEKDDLENDEKGEGWLSVEFLTDKSVSTRANPVYTLDICKSDNTPVLHYDDCSIITDRILLKAGSYKLTAFTGEDVVADFETPFYKAEQDVKIKSATTEAISMICKLANVKVTVAYSQKIKDNFRDYSLAISNDLPGGELQFASAEKRAGYLRENKGTMTWKLMLNNGQETYYVTKTIVGVEPQQHYKFNFDIKENGTEDDGAFTSGITVDTSTHVIESEFNIILKDTIPAPIIKGDGFDLKQNVTVLNETRGVNVRLNCAAQAKIQQLTLNHSSATLKGLGVPELLPLANISNEQAQEARISGITWSENILDAQTAWIDFSGLLNNKALPLGEYKFIVSLGDARNRTIIDTLKVTVIPDVDHIATQASNVWATIATLEGQWYSIHRPAGLTFEYSTDKTSWTKVNVSDITFVENGKKMSANISGLKPNTVYYTRTVSNDFISDDIQSFATEYALQLPNSNFDIWAQFNGKTWFAATQEEANAKNPFWDSGNMGASTMSKNPTSPESSDVHTSGGKSVKLESQFVGVGSIGQFAAGNLYTGHYQETFMSPMGARIRFGRPFTARPTQLKGWYKYSAGSVNYSKRDEMPIGAQDKCAIYIALTDVEGLESGGTWTAYEVNTKDGKFIDYSENNKNIIAYGELPDNMCNGTASWTQFTIDLKYRDTTRKPKYIIVVASASKYGDYFTGSKTSVMHLDDFELIYGNPMIAK